MLIHDLIFSLSIKRLIMKTTLLIFCLIALNVINIYSQDVKIGNQVWMAKNLDVSTFRNGDKIPEAKSNEEWTKAFNEGKPAWCYYNNKKLNQNGKLYNYYAVIDSRGLAPTGWEIPTSRQFRYFQDSLRYWELQSNKWGKVPCKKCDIFGFSALPVGWRDSEGKFEWKDLISFFWSRSEIDSLSSVRFQIYEKDGNGIQSLRLTKKGVGLSVRCIKQENNLQRKDDNLQLNRQTPKLGEYFEGGIVFHTWKDLNGKLSGLVVDIFDLPKAFIIPHIVDKYNFCYDSLESKLKSNISFSDGLSNQYSLKKYDCSYNGALYMCSESQNGGYKDWYVPSLDEFLIIDKHIEIINSSLSQINNAQYISGKYWTSNLVKEYDRYTMKSNYKFSVYDNSSRFDYKEAPPNFYSMCGLVSTEIGWNRNKIRAIRKFSIR
jgi:uncharacterized protein (TIGR02145 family)